MLVDLVSRKQANKTITKIYGAHICIRRHHFSEDRARVTHGTMCKVMHEKIAHRDSWGSRGIRIK